MRKAHKSYNSIIGGNICLLLQIFAQWQIALRSIAIVRMIVNAPLTFEQAYKYAQTHKNKLALVYW